MSEPRNEMMTPVTAAETNLLLARAKDLARVKQTSAAGTDAAIDVLEFGLADETYAFELPCVREVGALVELTPLPGVPRHIMGIACIHGQIIAVVDLRKIFNLPERGLRDSRQVIVLQSATMEFGILAERVVGIRRLSLAGLQTSLPTLTDVRAAYLTGITPEGTVVLSAAKLLADPQLVVQHQWRTTAETGDKTKESE
jgi:purine-binding chemotaxis protein CheW